MASRRQLETILSTSVPTTVTRGTKCSFLSIPVDRQDIVLRTDVVLQEQRIALIYALESFGEQRDNRGGMKHARTSERGNWRV